MDLLKGLFQNKPNFKHPCTSGQCVEAERVCSADDDFLHLMHNRGWRPDDWRRSVLQGKIAGAAFARSLLELSEAARPSRDENKRSGVDPTNAAPSECTSANWYASGSLDFKFATNASASMGSENVNVERRAKTTLRKTLSFS